MNRYILYSLLLASVPFIAVCLAVPVWDRIDPLIFGLPFNLAWLVAWIPLTSLCMAGVYRLWKRSHSMRTSAPEFTSPPAHETPQTEDHLR